MTRRAPSSRRLLIRSVVSASLPLLFVTFALIQADSRSSSSAHHRYSGPSGFLAGGPIPGVQVTLDAAQSVVAYRLPQLPLGSLPDPCTGNIEPLRLISVWASEDATPEWTQVGLAYSHGIWMSVSPLGMMAERIRSKAELPPVDSFVDGPAPIAVVDGTVRGQPAWQKEPAADLPCEGWLAEPSGGEPSPGNTDPVSLAALQQEALYFDGTVSGSLMWIERGVVIDLVGPYRTDELKALAKEIAWR